MLRVYTCLTAEHIWSLVLLAALICIATSTTTSFLYSRLGERIGKRKSIWLFGVALVFGTGVWATHFVAMLAYRPSVDFGFEIGPTIASLVLMLLTAFAAFLLLGTGNRFRQRYLAGCLIGVGISCMHFLGMTGLTVAGIKVWDGSLLAASVIFVMIFSVLACEALHKLKSKKGILIAGLLFVLAICSLHFIAMGALTILPSGQETVWNLTISKTNLALIIGMVALTVIQVGFGISYFDFWLGKSLKEKEVEINQYKSDLTDLTKTSKKEIETALNLLSRVIENLPAGVLIFDKDEKFVMSNKAYRQYVPSVADKMITGTDLYTFVEGFYEAHTGVETEDPEMDELHKTDKQAWIAERMKWYRTNNELEHFDDKGWTKVIDRRLEDGTYIGLRVDITELKTREAELEKARNSAEASNTAKSQFLANMSHEIRTPMNGILGMAQLLQTRDLDPHSKKFVDVIMKSGEALVKIINDILDFSKIEAGHVELDHLPFSLRESIDDVLSLISTCAGEKELDLIVQYEPGLPENYVGDAGRVRQMITNLVGNAVKFTDKGHVTVNVSGHVENQHAHLNISVEDTGIGIPESHIGEVFQKFSQVDQSSTRIHEGTGLGLSIVKTIVELMGGKISVESEYGKGSVFTLTVPLEIADSIDTRSLDKIVDVNVLIIDDNDVSRNSLKVEIEELKGRCIATRDLDAAKVLLNKVYENNRKFHVILINGDTTKFDELEVLRWLKSEPRYQNVPAIMLTSVVHGNVVTQYKEMGANNCVLKPINRSSLHDAIAGALGIITSSEANSDAMSEALNAVTPVAKTG